MRAILHKGEMVVPQNFASGLRANGNSLGGGIYNIGITASATGFTNWTRTSTDSNASSSRLRKPSATQLDTC